MTDPILTAHSLHKTYGPTRALGGVDVTIRRGESLTIMGASGVPTDVSGSSETARSRLRRERFGFVFQQGLLIPELTAIENVALAQMINGVRRQQALGHAASWLGSLGLSGMEERRIGELSGGQAQRVAIARSQITGAELVFADEPTGALDSQTSIEVMDALLWSTTAQGRTLVLVTHDAEVAARCSRTLHMRDGAIVSEAVTA